MESKDIRILRMCHISMSESLTFREKNQLIMALINNNKKTLYLTSQLVVTDQVTIGISDH